MADWDDLADEQYAYLTTTGRVSREPREIEIWFGVANGTLYMMSMNGDRGEWVRNAKAEPRVSLRIADRTFKGRARIVEDSDEDAMVRDLVVGKYEEGYSGGIAEYRRNALPVAVELDAG